MAVLTTIANIKAISKNEAKIQNLPDSDPLWGLVLSDVEKQVGEEQFGSLTEIAQRYLAAHFVSVALDGVVGELASTSVGGISQSFTVPYLNRRDVYGATQFGMEFVRIRDTCIPPFFVSIPSE